MALVVILGGGESGVGAAMLAKREGFDVFVSDNGKIEEQFKEDLNQHKVRFEESGHTFEIIGKAQIVIKSPGIPGHVSIVKQLRESGIPIISEIEFASRYCDKTIIGITGSNGKTTTTLLTYHLISSAGRSVGVGGNIGNSFARLLVEEETKDIYVLEISSFQLDDINTFSPDVSVILNITADHLDRYDGDMRKYGAAKLRIAENQNSKQLLIINGDDTWTDKLIGELKPKAKRISIHADQYEQTQLTTVSSEKIETKDSSLRGEHNRFNTLCAIEICMALGIEKEQIEKGLRTFKNAPHRLESVAVIDKVEYINDSKATNVESVYYALKAIDTPIVWIAGGKDKGNDYSSIEELVEQKVKAIICLGVDNEKLLDVFTPLIKVIEETQDINKALQLAQSYAHAGEVVMLSPACASFDLFNNYKHRGELFKEAVFNLLR